MDDDRVEKVLAVFCQNVPRGETVNEEFYLNVLKCLRAATRRKRPEAWTNNIWVLHHDNAPAHAPPLSVNFWGSMRRLLSPATLLSRFGPCGLFLVPEFEILTKRSPISDSRGDRRKFYVGPSRHPTKHVPELKKALGVMYQEWRGVLWWRQVWLSCKLSNKLKKNKVRFLYGLPSYLWNYSIIPIVNWARTGSAELNRFSRSGKTREWPIHITKEMITLQLFVSICTCMVICGGVYGVLTR